MSGKRSKILEKSGKNQGISSGRKSGNPVDCHIGEIGTVSVRNTLPDTLHLLLQRREDIGCLFQISKKHLIRTT